MTEKLLDRAVVARKLIKSNLAGDQTEMRIVGDENSGHKNGCIRSVLDLARMTEPGEQFSMTDFKDFGGLSLVYFRRKV